MNATNVTRPTGPLTLPIVLRRIIIYSIIVAITVGTNSLVIYIIATKKRLRTVSNGLMISMFVTGILFAVLYILPRWIYPYWTHSPFLCSMLPYTGVCLIVCSNLHQCAISLDRFLRVSLPFSYNNVARKRYAIVVIAIIVIISVISGFFLNIFYGFYHGDVCYVVFTQREIFIYRIYLIVVYASLFFAPLAVIFATYIRIFIIINSKSRQELYYKRSRQPRSTLQKNLKAAKQVAMMTGVYSLCWFPFMILTFVSAIAVFSGSASQTATTLLEAFQYLAFSYHAINPLLYAFITASVNQALTNYFRQICNLPASDQRDSRSYSTRSSFIRSNSMDLASQTKLRSNGQVKKSSSSHQLFEQNQDQVSNEKQEIEML
ncbi:uncharacterized protein TRIADDRAFT_59533 [Trichoplax adhaerens]|uniref:G-protein coupled receptors family 1 profile domain-containing protein n=1 Tax=Trichoplax adhaerens TaxID=10228 RepID=B3S5W7_TRIAD|nr:hypothetical protein TRIADDRAFT_59533 [Trichoplax adhaerens]EDV21879.1 hypothetical protein TRIADDRAFT_59533 [Trichoplax adhaerens]|eukprot:XP_002115516.1 hypothetical protein TRIADDRAFT_59533 [Trichoplax adhaerens]